MLGKLKATGEHIRIGSRVYYRENGPQDSGTVIDILLDDYPFVVKWDRQFQSHYETKVFSIPELGVEGYFDFNPADENIDQFEASQLAILEY